MVPFEPWTHRVLPDGGHRFVMRDQPWMGLVILAAVGSSGLWLVFTLMALEGVRLLLALAVGVVILLLFSVRTAKVDVQSTRVVIARYFGGIRYKREVVPLDEFLRLDFGFDSDAAFGLEHESTGTHFGPSGKNAEEVHEAICKAQRRMLGRPEVSDELGL